MITLLIITCFIYRQQLRRLVVILNHKEMVSVIIPTYKRVDSLERAILSVKKQTYQNIELIIVDDNGKDSVYSKKIKEMFNKKYRDVVSKYLVHKKNKGGAAARNTGIKASTGRYISFLDDDDEFLPNKLEKQINKIRDLDDSWGGVYCGYANFISNKKMNQRKNLTEGNLLIELLLMKNYIAAGSTLLVRREIFDIIGLFDTDFIRHQDWEFMIRFFSKFKLAFVNEILVILHRDDKQNKPSASKRVEITDMFFEKFEEIIDKLPEKERNKIYKRHNLELVRAFLLERKYKKAFYYYKKARSYESLTFAEFYSFCLNLVNSIIPVISLKNKIKGCLKFLFDKNQRVK